MSLARVSTPTPRCHPTSQAYCVLLVQGFPGVCPMPPQLQLPGMLSGIASRAPSSLALRSSLLAPTCQTSALLLNLSHPIFSS